LQTFAHLAAELSPGDGGLLLAGVGENDGDGGDLHEEIKSGGEDDKEDELEQWARPAGGLRLGS
jgi:hypothetical protein